MHGRFISTLVAAAIYALSAANALAGTYTVHGCRDAGGNPGAPAGDAQYGWQGTPARATTTCWTSARRTTARRSWPPTRPARTRCLWHERDVVLPRAPGDVDRRPAPGWAGSTASEPQASAAKARVDWGTAAVEHNHAAFGNDRNASTPPTSWPPTGWTG